MTIYGEYLFFENFIAGMLLIILTGKLTGNLPSWRRRIMGAIACGLSAFIIFIPMNAVSSVALRITMAVICTVISFGIKSLLLTSWMFLIMTFLAGGMVMALLLWLRQPAISHQGIIYMNAVTYLELICIGIIAFGMVYYFIKFVRKRNADVNMKGKVCLVIDGKNYFFRAFIDSGNSLKEPITGKPVILIDKRGAEKLPFNISDMPSRYRVIPYSGVGIKSGSIEALRTDKIVFQNKETEGVYLAFYKGVFADFEVLMHKEFLEGGLLQNV